MPKHKKIIPTSVPTSFPCGGISNALGDIAFKSQEEMIIDLRKYQAENNIKPIEDSSIFTKMLAYIDLLETVEFIKNSRVK